MFLLSAAAPCHNQPQQTLFVFLLPRGCHIRALIGVLYSQGHFIENKILFSRVSVSTAVTATPAL